MVRIHRETSMNLVDGEHEDMWIYEGGKGDDAASKGLSRCGIKFLILSITRLYRFTCSE